MNRLVRLFAAVAVVSSVPAFAASTLPGGADTLVEAHEDWTVRCRVASDAVQCSAQQEQLSVKTRQRVVAAEFDTAGENLSGTLVLPFGLALAKGALLKVDEQSSSPAQAFQTCLPSGCIVPLLLGRDWQNALRAGQSLIIEAESVDGKPARFALSLKGFGGAMDRITELTK